MIVAAALCPAAPLLVPALTGAEPVAPDLRSACLAAAADLAEAGADAVAVLGAGSQTRRWDRGSGLDLAAFAPGPGARRPAGRPGLPYPLGIGGWLLTEAGYRGDRLLQSVSAQDSAGRCAQAGAALAAARPRLALLVMADGSARRSLKAPGYFDDRSERFDAAVESAIGSGALGWLLSADRRLAGELMATGFPALQALAAAMAGGRLVTQVRYSGAPFGVGYLVASLRVTG